MIVEMLRLAATYSDDTQSALIDVQTRSTFRLRYFLRDVAPSHFSGNY